MRENSFSYNVASYLIVSFNTSSLLRFPQHHDYSCSDSFVSAGVDVLSFSVKLVQETCRNLNHNFLSVLFSQAGSPFFLLEADGPLHKVGEIILFKYERVASSVELFLNNAQPHHLLEVLDAAVIVASGFSGNRRHVKISFHKKNLENADARLRGQTIVEEHQLFGRNAERGRCHQLLTPALDWFSALKSVAHVSRTGSPPLPAEKSLQLNGALGLLQAFLERFG